MAAFTFGAGNARALLRTPLYLGGMLAARLVPRSPRLWVFGSGIGPGEGARELFELADRELPGVRPVWLSGSDAETARARALGMTVVRKDRWRGFRITLRASVVVVTHGFGDVNRFAVPGAFVVQLWHGIPLKKLHLDSPAALRLRPLPDHPVIRRVLRLLYRRAGRQIALFPAASAVSAHRLRSAFGLGHDVMAVTGDPRNDVLLRGTADDRRAAARDILTRTLGPLPPRIVLYAPTWRDGDVDPAAPTKAEWTAIAEWLEADDAVLLVRSHPLGAGDYADGPAGSRRVRMLGADVLPEVMPVLPAVDLLITDYSSIAYDYSLTGGPIALIAADLSRYETSRGLYEPYRRFSGDTHTADWVSLIVRADHHETHELSRRLRAEHFDHDDDGSARRVLAEILARTGAAAAPDTTSPPLNRPVLTRVERDGHVLVISGPSPVPASVRLSGHRLVLDGAVQTDAASWTARVPLTIPRWGSDALAPPSGRYRLILGSADGVVTARVDIRAPLAGPAVTDLYRVTVDGDDGGLTATFASPLRDDELTGQRGLERHYRTSTAEPQPAVFFESFYSQVVACNPRAIDRRLALERPDVIRYWSTVDSSVAIPDGAVRVLEGSREWWAARRDARLLVVNDWLRKRYRRRPHQKVLQTWHGTMLKRLALDRPHVSLRTRLAVVRESARWDIMLAQNPHSARIFRSAYRFRGDLWEEGYPRDDRLITTSGADIRERLGLPRDVRIVMYAPTWRDDRADLVDFLDLRAFAAELGDDTITLVRGHSRTLRHGDDIVGEHLLDVTSYPDVADLLAITDVLVTDYSSLMFDFSATGRPIVFYTPDVEHYGDDLRGFYFDLLAEAPGPVTQTHEDLVREIRQALTTDAAVGIDSTAQDIRYARWRARFNPHDDGHAAERVVRRILDAGLLD